MSEIQGWNFTLDVYAPCGRKEAEALADEMIAHIEAAFGPRVADVHVMGISDNEPMYGGPVTMEGSHEEGWNIW